MLGLSLDRVVEMSTSSPAKVLGREDDLGTLRVGSVADIALLESHTGQFQFTDSYQHSRVGETLLTAAATIRRGSIVPGGGGTRMRHYSESP